MFGLGAVEPQWRGRVDSDDECGDCAGAFDFVAAGIAGGT
jgi:hypothetical protein